MLLVRLCTGSNLGISLRKDAEHAGSDFVVDDSLVVFTDDVYAEFNNVVGVQLKWL
jgi:hypothetical protein